MGTVPGFSGKSNRARDPWEGPTTTSLLPIHQRSVTSILKIEDVLRLYMYTFPRTGYYISKTYVSRVLQLLIERKILT